MLYSSTPSFPPDTATGSPGELASTLVRAQMAMAGGLLRWSSESVGFLTARAQKDAEAMAQLANVRSPSDATTLLLRHAQSVWADYAAHGMKLGKMLVEDTETEAETLPAVTPPDASLPVAAPRVPATSAKPTRSDPV